MARDGRPQCEPPLFPRRVLRGCCSRRIIPLKWVLANVQIGSILDGKYRIERQIGAGAMGSVWEAEHTGTGRRVAVKVISSGDVLRDKALVGRFQREAKAAGAIDTQHITQVLDAGLGPEGSPYLVMEFLNGEDLQHIFHRLGPLAPDLALRLAAQTCLGLQKAHEAEVVHRDIKPANLFLAQRDAGERIVKLLDFGIAKVKMDHANDAENAALTKTGSMLGSPLYMSPEQAKGLKSIDHRTDLWSLGVVLYQALTGRTPFDQCDALGALIIAICHEEPTPIQAHAPWIPPEVANIVHMALRRDPAERFPSAAALFEAMRPLLPYGWAVTSDMLSPLGDTARARVAPLLPMPAPMEPVTRAGPSNRPLSIPPTLGSVRPGSSHQLTNVAATTGALTQSHANAGPKGRTAMIAGAATVAAAIAGGVFVMRASLVKPLPPAAMVQLPAPVSATSPPAAPAVVPSVMVVAEDTRSQEPTATRRVKVVILPSDATVEVEGVKTALREGLLEITGKLGSVHRVRVFKGKIEDTKDVIVTEAGPSIPKIELPSGGRGTGGKTPPQHASASGSATPALPPGIRGTFD